MNNILRPKFKKDDKVTIKSTGQNVIIYKVYSKENREYIIKDTFGNILGAVVKESDIL